MITAIEKLQNAIDKILSEEEMTFSEVRETLSELKESFSSPEINENVLSSFGVSTIDCEVILNTIKAILKYKKGMNKHFVRSLYNLQTRLEKMRRIK